MDLVSYLSGGLPGAGLRSGLTAVYAASWERGCGVNSAVASLHLAPWGQGSALSPRGLEVTGKANGQVQDSRQATSSGN